MCRYLEFGDPCLEAWFLVSNPIWFLRVDAGMRCFFSGSDGPCLEAWFVSIGHLRRKLITTASSVGEPRAS